MARGARSATVCEAVAVKWANASNRRGPSARLYSPRCRSPRPRRSSRLRRRSRAASRRSPAIALSRGSAVVCIPVFGAGRAVRPVPAQRALEHTPPDVPVLVADDASLDPACARLVEEVNAANPERPPVGYHRQPENVGFVHNVNDALRTARAGRRDRAQQRLRRGPGLVRGHAPRRHVGHARGNRVHAHQQRHDPVGAGAQPPVAEPAAGLVARRRRGRGARRRARGCTRRSPQPSVTASTSAAGALDLVGRLRRGVRAGL